MGVKIREKEKGSGVFWIFVNHHNHRTSRQVGTLKAAEKAKTQIEARLTLGEWVEEEKPTPTIAEYYKRFERVYLKTSTRQGTQDRYAVSYQHILPELGSIRLGDLTRERVKDFVAHLVAKRYTKRVKVKTYPDPTKQRKPVVTWKETEHPLARTTIRIILNELCSLLNHAVEENVIAANPALKLGKFYNKQSKVVHDEIQCLTPEEVQLFLATVQKQSPEYFPLFLCALHTGMREGELAGLEWGDLDFHGKFFLLRRQFNRGKLQPTKTGKVRRVDMSDTLATELHAMKVKRQAEYLERGSNEVPDCVFMGRGRLKKEGKRDEPTRVDMNNLVKRHFNKCLAKAGLRRIRFHDLRHSYATLLLMQGESVVYVKEQLGHSSIKVTVDLYSHWIPGANRQAVNKLPSLAASA